MSAVPTRACRLPSAMSEVEEGERGNGGGIQEADSEASNIATTTTATLFLSCNEHRECTDSAGITIPCYPVPSLLSSSSSSSSSSDLHSLSYPLLLPAPKRMSPTQRLSLPREKGSSSDTGGVVPLPPFPTLRTSHPTSRSRAGRTTEGRSAASPVGNQGRGRERGKAVRRRRRRRSSRSDF